MQNLSDILPLFCTPTWLSYHVSENQGYFHRFFEKKKNLTGSANFPPGYPFLSVFRLFLLQFDVRERLLEGFKVLLLREKRASLRNDNGEKNKEVRNLHI